MSWETQNWAMRQKPDHPSDKFVLIGMASCADANHNAFPSAQWLCEFTGYDRKTVIDAIKRLAGGLIPLISDTGERRGRTKQVKVYRLCVDVPGGAKVQSDPESGTVPKPEQFRNRNSPAFSAKGSRKRDTEPFKEPIPPCSPDGEQTPTGAATPSGNVKSGKGQARKPKREPAGSRLAEDWTPPPIADLSPAARRAVAEWPMGAYEAVCETFRLHWLAETGPRAFKRDWTAALGKWLLADHAKVMRDARAGVSFAHFVPVKASTRLEPVAPPAVVDKAGEDATSEAIHAEVRKAVGESAWRQWLAPAALLVSDAPGDLAPVVRVVAGSEFARGWIEERHGAAITSAARLVLRGETAWVRFDVGEVVR